MSHLSHLPADSISIILRDVTLSKMNDGIKQRELREAASYLAPVFEVWARITHYEKHFPGSTESPGAVVYEP